MSFMTMPVGFAVAEGQEAEHAEIYGNAARAAIAGAPGLGASGEAPQNRPRGALLSGIFIRRLRRYFGANSTPRQRLLPMPQRRLLSQLIAAE
jgi:hypothetical protein